MQYLIQRVDNPSEFWDNEWGWMSIEDATAFTKEEAREYDLPIGGRWIGQARMFAANDLYAACQYVAELTDPLLPVAYSKDQIATISKRCRSALAVVHAMETDIDD